MIHFHKSLWYSPFERSFRNFWVAESCCSGLLEKIISVISDVITTLYKFKRERKWMQSRLTLPCGQEIGSTYDQLGSKFWLPFFLHYLTILFHWQKFWCICPFSYPNTFLPLFIQFQHPRQSEDILFPHMSQPFLSCCPPLKPSLIMPGTALI